MKISKYLIDLNLRVRWSKLRRLGQSRILRSSYFWLFFVPIASKFLLQLPDPLRIEMFGQVHTISFRLPFSWVAFYFAAVAFSIASLMFVLWCPEMIKRYTSFSEFYTAGNGIRALGNLLASSPAVKEATYFWQQITRDVDDAVIAAGKRSEQVEGSPSASDEQEKVEYYRRLTFKNLNKVKREEMADLFTLTTSLYDRQWPILRIIAAVFYLIGFGLTGVVFCQGVFSVLRVIWHD